MMNKSIEVPKIKTIVVKCLNRTDTIDVDENLFDDTYMEAATRFLEKNRSVPDFSVSVVITCYEKKDEKDVNKHICYNTYLVLINSALHEKAEMLRLNFLKTYKIDLQKESLHGNESKFK